MSAVPTIDASVLECHPTEWRLVTAQPCNVLVEGSVPATDAFVHLLLPHIREPIVEHRPPTTLNHPTGETGALIVWDAAALTRDKQRRLLAWIDDAGSRAEIITTASCRLFALVDAGVFDAALYYRLNVLLLRATDTSQSGLLFGSAKGASPQQADC
jgi:hypothetical protein